MNELLPIQEQEFFTLGKWTVKSSLNQISDKEKSYAIEPKMMDVLVYLCQHSTQTVSAEQLLIACWAGTFYGDAPVQKCIAGLRKKLGCNSRKPSYIETIHRRGYKIIADVSLIKPSKQAPEILNIEQWTQGSPYRGLNTFETVHSPIYFGRTKAIAEVIQSLTYCIDQHCHFLLLLGKSGSGKSSLIRAGVLPFLSSHTGFSEIRVTQHIIVTPHQNAHESPIASLLHSLNSLGLIKPNLELDGLIARVEETPELIIDALIVLKTKEVEARESNIPRKEPKNYCLLVVDQFEQFLLDDSLSDLSKSNLVLCLKLLSQYKALLCIAMLRNDFYSRCLDVEGFIDLKNRGIQYDLQVASPLELTQIIRNPALAAGLKFEHDEASGEQLDDILLAAAIKNPDALPLLEYTLERLYQQRSQDNELLISAYHKMGGIEGAIAQQAEKVFNSLPYKVQGCWDKIMHALVRIDHDDKHSVTSRKVPLSFFKEDNEQKFIQHFLSAQLFTTIIQTAEGEQRSYFSIVRGSSVLISRDDVQFITIAHEALLVNWQRVTRWVKENSAAIQKREQLADDCQYWLINHKSNDALLNSRHKIKDGLRLIQRNAISLNNNEINFILKSQRYQNRKKTLAVLVVLAVFGSSLLTWLQSKELAVERDIAVSKSNQTQAISKFLTDMFFSQSPYFLDGKEMLVKDVLAKASLDLDKREQNNLRNQPYVNALLHKTLGTIYIDLGKIPPAEKHLMRALSIYKRNQLDQGKDYLGILFNVSRLYNLKADHTKNLPIILETISLSKKLVGEDHQDTLGAIDNLATFYLNMGNFEQAEPLFNEVYLQRKQLFGPHYRHTLYSLENLGKLYQAKGDWLTSERYLQLCINEWLAQSTVNNPYTLNCMRLLAVTKESLAKLQEAEQLLNEHITVASAVFSAHHPEVLSAKNTLAQILSRTKREKDAERLMRQTLKERKLVLGGDHIDTLKTQISLATLLRQMNSYDQALILAQEALEKCNNTLGINHPTTILASQELSLLNSLYKP